VNVSRGSGKEPLVLVVAPPPFKLRKDFTTLVILRSPTTKNLSFQKAKGRDSSLRGVYPEFVEGLRSD